MSQIIAARRFSWSMTFSVPCTVAMPVANVTRLPPVTCVKPIEAVSATIGFTRSTGIPSVSAAIIAIEAREPPISGLREATLTEPSSLMCTCALDAPPTLNQKPQATPRP
jgi:hypothetical protein